MTTQPTTSAISKKECRDCRRELPLEAFYRLSRAKDGRGTHCKRCVKARYTPARPSAPTLGPSAPQPHQWPEAPTPCQEPEAPGLWLSEREDHRARAARLCHACPAFDLCRQLAQAAEPTFGVWAGADYTTTTIKETA